GNIPAGYVGLVHPRSGHAHKHGITVNNAPGTIDSGYVGNIRVNLINHGRDPIEIKYGERIAQLLIQQVELSEREIVDSLEATERGASGHWSTGAYTMPNSRYFTLYQSLLDDVRALKRHLQSMAGLSKHSAKDAF